MKTRLLSYSIIKRKQAWKPQSHSFPPWHPTPITLTLSLSYLPPYLFCQLLHYSFPSLLGYFSCSSVPLTSALCTNPLMTLSLSLSVSHLPSLSDLGCFFFFFLFLLPQPEIGSEGEKKKEKKWRENASDAPTCIGLSISMVAWPPETAHHAPLHSKRAESREGAKKGEAWRGERAKEPWWKKLVEHWSGSLQTQEVKSLIISVFTFQISSPPRRLWYPVKKKNLTYK